MSNVAALSDNGITGLYPGLSRADYEAIPGINVSRLEWFERSAAHARENMLHPQEPTEAMEFGTALHCAVLEPQRFASSFVAAPKCDRRTKDGKAAWKQFEAEHPNAELLDADDFTTIQRMREALWLHPTAKEMLRGGAGHNEVGVVWIDEETGLLCKALLDRIGAFDGWTWIVDMKSTQDASRKAFSRSVKNFNYGAKAAFYLDGCNTVAPRPRRFAWIAIEKEPPHCPAVYEADDTALRAGRLKYKRWLRLYQEAKESGNWPGYDPLVSSFGEEETEWR